MEKEILSNPTWNNLGGAYEAFPYAYEQIELDKLTFICKIAFEFGWHYHIELIIVFFIVWWNHCKSGAKIIPILL